MCVIFLAYDKHPDYKLILAGNRDEFYDRPTAPMSWWDDETQILAGKDLTHGGTWLGAIKSGRIATVTNYRDFFNPPFKGESRGFLIKDFLTSKIFTEDYLKLLELRKNKYDGYNLLLYDNNELYYQSNKLTGYYQIPPGIYGLSNATLDTPWPKVSKGKKMLTDIINRNEFRADLLELLQDKEVYPDEKLPDTGIGIEKERWLSSIFVKSETYGTRSSTILTVDRDNNVEIDEYTYNDATLLNFKFKIDKS